jgi:hypothetical protein
MSLTIADSIYNRIMASVGFPIVNEDDLGVNKDFVKETLILPAMMYYYKFFPIRSKVIYSVDMSWEVPFPDSNTIGVLSCRMNSNVLGGGTHVQNPLINEQNITIATSGGSRGMWGTQNDYGMTAARTMRSNERQGIIENARTFRYQTNENTRVVEGFTNIFGRLEIEWAKMSENFADISFRRQEEVIMLAKAYVCEYFGGLRKQATSSLPTEMTGDDLIEQADKWREKVETLWQEFTKVAIQRG